MMNKETVTIKVRDRDNRNMEKAVTLFDGLKTVEILNIVTGKDVTLCPCCSRGRMHIIRTLLAHALT